MCYLVSWIRDSCYATVLRQRSCRPRASLKRHGGRQLSLPEKEEAMRLARGRHELWELWRDTVAKQLSRIQDTSYIPVSRLLGVFRISALEEQLIWAILPVTFHTHSHIGRSFSHLLMLLPLISYTNSLWSLGHNEWEHEGSTYSGLVTFLRHRRWARMICFHLACTTYFYFSFTRYLGCHYSSLYTPYLY